MGFVQDFVLAAKFTRFTVGVLFQDNASDGAVAVPVLCRQEIRYYCPVQGCRYMLPSTESPVQPPELEVKGVKFFREMRYLKEVNVINQSINQWITQSLDWKIYFLCNQSINQSLLCISNWN